MLLAARETNASAPVTGEASFLDAAKAGCNARHSVTGPASGRYHFRVTNGFLRLADGNDAGLTLDDVANGLQQLRLATGNVSYQEIATRITMRRIAAGVALHGAKVSRSTVYGAFQLGRARMNADLVGEIVTVLTEDAELGADWRGQCLNAHTGEQAIANSVTESLTSVTDNLENERIQSPIVAHVSRPIHAPADAPVSTPVATPAKRKKPFAALSGVLDAQYPTNLNSATIALILIAGVIINVLPSQLLVLFPTSFPIFLDMIGTAIVAITFGPLLGVATAALSLLPFALLAAPYGMAPVALWLAPVSIVGALLWGFGAQLPIANRSLTRFTLLNVVVGVACSLIAVAIILGAFDGNPYHTLIQHQADTAATAGLPTPVAVLSANLFANILDKILTGIIALMVAGGLLRRYAPPPIVALLEPFQAEMVSSNAAHPLFSGSRLLSIPDDVYR